MLSGKLQRTLGTYAAQDAVFLSAFLILLQQHCFHAGPSFCHTLMTASGKSIFCQRYEVISSELRVNPTLAD